MAPPQSVTSKPRWSRYQAPRLLGSADLKKMPPMPVTRFIVLLLRSSSSRLPTAVPLLVLFLPVPGDLTFLLLAAEFRRAFPLELVTFNRQRVVDGDFVIHELPHGGKRQSFFLQHRVLEVRLLLIRPGHRPDEFLSLLLHRQRGRPLLVADLVLALPRADRVCFLALRTRQAA